MISTNIINIIYINCFIDIPLSYCTFHVARSHQGKLIYFRTCAVFNCGRGHRRGHITIIGPGRGRKRERRIWSRRGCRKGHRTKKRTRRRSQRWSQNMEQNHTQKWTEEKGHRTKSRTQKRSLNWKQNMEQKMTS